MSVSHPHYNEILWLLVLPIHIVFVLSNRIFVSVKLFFFERFIACEMYFITQFVSVHREIRYQNFKYLGYFTSFQRFVLSFIDLTHRYKLFYHLIIGGQSHASFQDTNMVNIIQTTNIKLD